MGASAIKKRHFRCSSFGLGNSKGKIRLRLRLLRLPRMKMVMLAVLDFYSRDGEEK